MVDVKKKNIIITTLIMLTDKKREQIVRGRMKDKIRAQKMHAKRESALMTTTIANNKSRRSAAAKNHIETSCKCDITLFTKMLARSIR